MNSERKLISSGSPYEKTVGFSRAVRVGSRVLVSGTAPIGEDGRTVSQGDAHGQARRCLEIIRAALEESGAALTDVVRIRVFLVDRAEQESVSRAIAECFADIRPAATMVIVAGLLDTEWLVEIEAEAEVL